MGSFYATCSITRQTIKDEQPMYVQFLVPTLKLDYLQGLSQLMSDESEFQSLEHKGMTFTHACQNWVPFGPPILGTYNDYGRIKPSDDDLTSKNISILEHLMGGIPFSSIFEIAFDDRWYTIGLNKDTPLPNNSWTLEGVTSDISEWKLSLYKNLTLTYFHAEAYNQLSNSNFSGEEKDGICGEYMSKVIEKREVQIKSFIDDLVTAIKNLPVEDDKGLSSLLYEHMILSKFNINKSPFSHMRRDLLIPYLLQIASLDKDLDWLYKSFTFISNMTSMNLILDRSQIGGQQTNHFGWSRILDAVSKTTEPFYRKFYSFDKLKTK